MIGSYIAIAVGAFVVSIWLYYQNKSGKTKIVPYSYVYSAIAGGGGVMVFGTVVQYYRTGMFQTYGLVLGLIWFSVALIVSTTLSLLQNRTGRNR